MNILFTMVNGKPSANKGGGEKIIYLLAKSFQKRNIISYFFSSEFFIKLEKGFFSTSKIKYTKPKTIINNLLSFNIFLKIYYLYPVYKSLILLKKIRFFLKKNIFQEFDLIHAHEPISLFLIPKQNEKRVLTIHSKGSFIDELKLKYNFISHRVIEYLQKIELEGIKSADIITFPSNYARNLFKKKYDILTLPNLEVINNGIEEEEVTHKSELFEFVKSIKNQNEIFILNIANHVEEKRIDLTLKVIWEFKRKKKNAFLVNVGCGPLTENLNNQIKELGIRDRVKFLGKLPNHEVNYLMKSSDFFLITSEKSIFDLVILEAIQNGCRILCNKEGGNSEMIINGYNGYLADNNLPIEYVHLIQNFDDTILENLNESKIKYSVENMSSKYFALYETVSNEN